MTTAEAAGIIKAPHEMEGRKDESPVFIKRESDGLGGDAQESLKKI